MTTAATRLTDDFDGIYQANFRHTVALVYTSIEGVW